jgi:hypothetical protein
LANLKRLIARKERKKEEKERKKERKKEKGLTLETPPSIERGMRTLQN